MLFFKNYHFFSFYLYLSLHKKYLHLVWVNTHVFTQIKLIKLDVPEILVYDFFCTTDRQVNQNHNFPWINFEQELWQRSYSPLKCCPCNLGINHLMTHWGKNLFKIERKKLHISSWSYYDATFLRKSVIKVSINQANTGCFMPN